MSQSRTRSFVRLCLAGLAIVALSCSGDPVARARKYVERGDRYLASGKVKEAVIEYGNAVKARPGWADVYYKRARAYTSLNDPVHAYQAYARAADLDPSNIDAQLQAGMLLLAGGEFEGAGERAQAALRKQPKNAPAHILLGNALAGLKDVPRALRQIEEAIALDPSSAPAWTALGAVRLRSGSDQEAAAAFQRAVALDPTSIDARLSLANYQWTSGDIPTAERTLKDGLALNPGNELVHRALALFYVATRRQQEAEPHFKALAQRSDSGRLTLADFYLQVDRPDDAAAVLHTVEKSKDIAAARAARLRLAGIEYARGRKSDGYHIVDALINEKPHQIDARLVKARMLLADNNPGQAAAQTAEALKMDSGSTEAHYLAGLAALAQKRTDEAELAFEQVTTLNPRAAAAHLQLARLRLGRGDAARALMAAEQAASLQPDDVDSAVLLTRTLRAKGDLPRARRELESMIQRLPKSAVLRAELGWLCLQQRDTRGARTSFDAAIALDPALDDARSGRAATDLMDGHVPAARSIVEQWLKEAPDNPRLRILSAQVHLAGGDTAQAERILREIVVTDPSQLDAYDLLGRIYVANGQTDRALAEYRSLAAHTATPAAVLTLIGLLEDARGDRAAARAGYEKALAADPAAATAANNLAWLYAEDGRLDDALRLATSAERALEQRPEPADTLGWVYYRKGLFARAIEAFEKALARAPEKALYHYHLGLARLKAGQRFEGRAAIQHALGLGLASADAAAAKAALETAAAK
jgi:putative PEP-CTERM system TPR-repeat lipoprotein